MLITVKSVNEILNEKNEPKNIEWNAVGADGHEVKVKLYPSIKQGDAWLHFEERWDEFKDAKDKTYDIERANIKLEKGYWKPVIKATEIKDVMMKEATRKVTEDAIDNRQVSIEGQVALKEIGEMIRADNATFMRTHQDLVELYFIKLYDMMNKFVYGGSNVKETTKDIPKPKTPEETGDDSGGEEIPIETPEGMAEFKQLQGQVKVTPRDLEKWGLPPRDGRATDLAHYYSDCLNNMEKATLRQKMKDQLSEPEQIPF